MKRKNAGFKSKREMIEALIKGDRRFFVGVEEIAYDYDELGDIQDSPFSVIEGNHYANASDTDFLLSKFGDVEVGEEWHVNITSPVACKVKISKDSKKWSYSFISEKNDGVFSCPSGLTYEIAEKLTSDELENGIKD